MPYLSTPQLQFHYRVHGAPDGLPMLFLHGSFASSRWWEPLFALLPAEIYAIAPDLRGCGLSEKPAGGYTIENQAADLWAFVDALGWQNFDLVGHASGAAIAVEFALKHGAYLSTLALIDPAPVEGIFTPIEVMMALDEMRTDEALLRQALASLMPTYIPTPLSIEDDEKRLFFDALVADAQGMAPAAFTAIAESLNQWNRFAAVHALTLPTVLIWGEHDHLVSRDAMTRSLIAIPGANNLEVIRGVGHSPMLEAPFALAERLLEFVTEDYANFAAARTVAEERGPQAPTDRAAGTNAH